MGFLACSLRSVPSLNPIAIITNEFFFYLKRGIDSTPDITSPDFFHGRGGMIDNNGLLMSVLSDSWIEVPISQTRSFFQNFSYIDMLAPPPKGVPRSETYNFYKDLIAPLPQQTNRSQIYSQYACSVPVMKSGVSLAISIIVADVVFLSAVWTILNWCTTKWLTRSDHTGSVCPCCLERQYEQLLLAPFYEQEDKDCSQRSSLCSDSGQLT